jgi:iron-sulfur cluster assembly protein
MIEITPAAAAEISRIQSLGAADTKLHITLGTSTCEQFYYQLSLANTLVSTEPIAKGASEAIAGAIVQVGDIAVSIDAQYRQYLENIQIDFAQDLMGGGFRFQNPQAKKVCGCGNAFSV